MQFLGHVVSKNGISPDAEKTEPLTERPTPVDADDLRSFLGLTGYYRDHIDGYATIVGPLQILLRQETPWTWGDTEERAFKTLIKALTSRPILGHPRHEGGGWVVDVDASGVAIGAVLSQEQEGKEVVIRYASKYL